MRPWEVADAMRRASELGVGLRDGGVDPVGYLVCKHQSSSERRKVPYPIEVFRSNRACCSGCEEKCCVMSAREAFEECGIPVDEPCPLPNPGSDNEKVVAARQAFAQGAYARPVLPRGILAPGRTTALLG